MPGLPPSMKPAVYKPQKGYPQYTPFQQSRRLPFIDVGGKGKEHHEKALVDWERYFRTRRFKIGSIENALGFSSSKKGRRRHGGFAL